MRVTSLHPHSPLPSCYEIPLSETFAQNHSSLSQSCKLSVLVRRNNELFVIESGDK